MSKSTNRKWIIGLLLTILVGLFLFFPSPKTTGHGQYQEFIIDDVTKSQHFSTRFCFLPVVFRYRIEGVVDDSASVSFQTDMDSYGHVGFKGVVADSMVRDFLEFRSIRIYYQPKGVKQGRLVIKTAFTY